MAKASEYENMREVSGALAADKRVGGNPILQSPVSHPGLVPSIVAETTVASASPSDKIHKRPIHSVLPEPVTKADSQVRNQVSQQEPDKSPDDPAAGKKPESITSSDIAIKLLSPKELHEELSSELEEGIISSNAIEAFQIAVPTGEDRYQVENPKQNAFSTYMQGITNRLLSSDFAQQHLVKGKQIPEFKYFITDEDGGVNTSIVSDAQPPIVLITKELLQRVAEDGREDILAGVMAHELTHYYLSQYRKRNSKVEESVAYGLPTFLLYHADYQYTGMREAFALRKDSERMDEYTKYVDVHPGCKLSERIAEDSEGILAQHLRRQRKDFDGIPLAEPTPLPEEVGQLVEEFTFVDVINSEFSEAGFNTTPYADKTVKKIEDAEVTKQKLQFIQDNMDRWLDVDGQELGNVARNERVTTLNALLQKCFYKEGVTLQLSLEDKIPLLDKILTSELPIDTHSLTFQVSGIEKDGIFFTNRKFQHPPQTGMLHDVGESFDAMFALTQLTNEQLTIADAAERSERLIETLSRIHPEHRDILRRFYFGEIADLTSLEDKIKERKSNMALSLGIASTNGITPPWDELVVTALDQYNQTGQSSIAEALLVIGINDPRLAAVPTHNPITITHNGKPEGEFTYMEAGFPKLRLDHQGKILGLTHEISDYSGDAPFGSNLQQRRRRVFQANRGQIAELQAVEASLMEGLQHMQTPDELNKLLWLYPQHLTTPNFLLGGEIDAQDNTPLGSNAAALLTQRLEFFAKEDPDVWVPVIKALFSERYKSKYANEQQTPLTMSVHDVQQRLRSHSLDSPLGSSTNNFRDLEADDDVLIPILLPDEMGMALTHPYVQFVLRHTENFTTDAAEIYFSKEQALSLLDKTVVTHVRTPEGENISPPTTLHPEIYFQFLGVDGFAQTDSELAQRLTALRNIDPSVTWVSENNSKPDSEKWSSRFLLLHARNEIYQYLKSNPSAYLSPEAFEESLKAIKASVGRPFWQEDFRTGRAFIPEITELLREQFMTNADYDRMSGQRDPQALASMYTVFEKYGFFQRYPSYRWDEDNGYDPLIYQELHSFQEKNVDPTVIRNFAETILYGCTVQSPELRNELIAAWGEAIKQQHGVDKTNAFDDMAQHVELASYYSAVTEIVDEVLEKTPKGLLHESMLQTLANTLETQSALTRHIFTQTERVSKEQLLESTQGVKGPLAEFGMDLIIANDETRLATIDFLTETLTDEALEKFVDVMERRFSRGTYTNRDNTTAFVKSPMDELFGKLLANVDVDFQDPKIRERIKGKLRASYDNFWDARIEQRAYYMNLLAFPEKNGKNDTPEFQELVDYVINKVLPYNGQLSPESSFNKYTTFGRDLVLAYLDDASLAEQRLLLSGLMVSAKKMGEATDRDDISIGKALAFTLMNMGPAGTKLAQAIDSYPQTPEPIRKGMDGVKGEPNKPTRQEVFTRMEEVLAASNGTDRIKLADIDHVGPVLGTGAYQYALHTELHEALDGYNEIALTLLRDHVYIFAQNEFRHIQHAFDGFVQRRNDAGDAVTPATVQAMRHVIAQASASSTLETDYDIGKVQADLLRTQYDGLAVHTANRTIAFKTVTWLEHGMTITESSEGNSVQAYKAANIAPGKPFNTFSKTATAEELIDLGVALQITEDMMTLSGKHFDHDRHGDNFNVLRVEKDMQIGDITLKPGDLLVMHYDLGAVNIDPPTSQEKEELGQILAATLQTVLSEEGDIKTTLLNQITERLGEQNRDTSYLSAVLRGLLARGDFLRNLTQVDIQTAAVALFNSGTIDDEIANSLLIALTSEGNDNAEQLLQFLTDGSSQISVELPEAMKKNNS